MRRHYCDESIFSRVAVSSFSLYSFLSAFDGWYLLPTSWALSLIFPWNTIQLWSLIYCCIFLFFFNHLVVPHHVVFKLLWSPVYTQYAEVFSTLSQVISQWFKQAWRWKKDQRDKASTLRTMFVHNKINFWWYTSIAWKGCLYFGRACLKWKSWRCKLSTLQNSCIVLLTIRAWVRVSKNSHDSAWKFQREVAIYGYSAMDISKKKLVSMYLYIGICIWKQ